MLKTYRILTLAILLLPVALEAESDFKGELGFETRWFPDDPADSRQFDDFQSSFYFEPEWSWESKDRSQQAKVTLFGRVDNRDDERTHIDLRDMYWEWVDNNWEILVGINRVFWGVAESRHLVNVINQIDQVESIDEESFLGQPMVNLSYESDLGRFSLYLMSGFRERTFPSEEGRFRTPIPVDASQATYASNLDRWHPEIALRYTTVLGDWDVGAYVFHGIGREPTLSPSLDLSRLIPQYELITQAGLDLQYTREAWLWKLETMVRKGQGRTFSASVGGFEYTLYQILNSNYDLGLLVEYLYDDRGGQGSTFTPLDNDLFLAFRLALNDINDTALLAGVFVDLNDGSGSLRVEASKRLNDFATIEIEAQGFHSDSEKSDLNAFKEDSYIGISLKFYY